MIQPFTAAPIEVTFEIRNTAPNNGTYLTPVWLGFHDGTFDFFNMGEPASMELERIAEDGNAQPLMDAFEENFDTQIQRQTFGRRRIGRNHGWARMGTDTERYGIWL